MTPKKPSISEKKYNETEATARKIIAAEAATQNAKTERLKQARLKQEARLDEALDESFPASDPVEIGHSTRVGRPKQARKKGHLWKR